MTHDHLLYRPIRRQVTPSRNRNRCWNQTVKKIWHSKQCHGITYRWMLSKITIRSNRFRPANPLVCVFVHWVRVNYSNEGAIVVFLKKVINQYNKTRLLADVYVKEFWLVSTREINEGTVVSILSSKLIYIWTRVILSPRVLGNVLGYLSDWLTSAKSEMYGFIKMVNRWMKRCFISVIQLVIWTMVGSWLTRILGEGKVSFVSIKSHWGWWSQNRGLCVLMNKNWSTYMKYTNKCNKSNE